MKTITFKNKHGEEFKLIKGEDKVTYLGGSEVSTMTPSLTIGLFNPAFNIWSDQELVELGKALQKLYAG